MHKVIASSINHVHIWKHHGGTIAGVFLAGIKQHLRYTRCRSTCGDRVAPLGESNRTRLARGWHPPAAVVPTKPNPLAFFTDFAQHGGKGNDGPVTHFTIMRTLQRPSPCKLSAVIGK